MSRFVYLIYGTAVLTITTLINLSDADDDDTPSRSWSSSRSSGGGWFSGGHHK